MKTSALPSLRVEPALREKVEEVLRDGETLSSFMETAVRETIRLREAEARFLAQGLEARDEARELDTYFSAADVIEELGAMLGTAKARRPQ